MNLEVLQVGMSLAGELCIKLPDGVVHGFETGEVVSPPQTGLQPMQPIVEQRIRTRGLHPQTVLRMLEPENATALGI